MATSGQERRLLFSTSLALRGCLSNIKPTSSAQDTATLWYNMCLGYLSKSDDSFLPYPERPPPLPLPDDNDNDNDTKQFLRVVRFVYQDGSTVYRDSADLELEEKTVLLIECRRASCVAEDWASASGNEQLRRYCEMYAGDSGRVWAATAVGRKARFWRYEAPSLSPLSEVLDLDVVSEQEKACKMLDYVRGLGWSWIEERRQ